MSTSLGDNGTVSPFADKDMVLHLSVPEGHPALGVESIGAFGGGERELLLGRGTQYEVTRGFVGTAARSQIEAAHLARALAPSTCTSTSR